MEGIIPFIFKVVAQYKEGGHVSLSDMISDKPSPASYVLLPGDSDGRHADDKTQPLRLQASTGSEEEVLYAERYAYASAISVTVIDLPLKKKFSCYLMQDCRFFGLGFAGRN
uniref:Uncharacterized protein n=1 Tax=Oryza glaberrima TaxID=4538 RepID=I1NTB2_ORYGL